MNANGARNGVAKRSIGEQRVGSDAGGVDDEDGVEPAHRVQWRWSYDRASIERFLEEIEIERGRLEAELAEANARIERARARTPAPGPGPDGAVPAELATLVKAAQEELAELEREHRASIARIRESATDEAMRIIGAAHRGVRPGETGR